MRSFFTTPIFYANAKPHLGHAYTLCMADAWSRFSAIRHHPSLQAFPPRRVSMRPPSNLTSFLCTGVDEHGSKIARTAMDRNCSPQELCDSVSISFADLCSKLNISTSAFIRTTNDLHKAVVHDAWKRLENSGYLYWSTYSGWYSTTDETFYGDWEVTYDYKKGVKVSKASGNEVQWVEEETCRFRLADFKHHLHKWLDSGALPKESQEHARLLSLTHTILDLLEDPSLSRPRSRVPWGISVPSRPDHTIYVWFDALMNYLTAGKVSGVGDSEAIWPPEIQFIGKDILRFHAILWPAILMALGLPLPKLVIPHGHILVSGVKMSKSLGNIVSPDEVLNHFASFFTGSDSFTEPEVYSVTTDCLRYCLIRSACLQEDITFSLPLAIETVNAELVNSLGNLLSRISSKKVTPTHTAPILDIVEAQDFMSDPLDAEFFNDLRNLPSTVDSLWFDHLQPHHCVDAVMRVVRHANAFVDRHRPWDTNRSSSKTVVGVTLETLRLVGCLLSPLIPTLSNRLLCGIGLEEQALRCFTWRLPNDGPLKRPLIPRFRP